MTRARVPQSRRAAALVSAVVILVVVAAFATVILSVHNTQITTLAEQIQRLRAQAATAAATQLTLWKLRHDADLQDAVARAVQEHDTSFEAPALFSVSGNLAGATFSAELWPGPDTVRIRAVGTAGGVYDQCWGQMPIQLPPPPTP
jgi:predicted PurR-regulated permease PerM